MANPLATQGDLAARLGRPLGSAEAARADALLADASALVRSYTRQTFDLVTADVIVLRPIGTVLRLPQRPVIDVDSVVALSGRDDVADFPLTNWVWDGIDKVNVGAVCRAPSFELVDFPEWWWEWVVSAGTYRVTYDHGYPETPEDVLAVVCGMVNRVLLSPTMVEGLTSERIGQYGYQYAQFQGGQSPGAQVRLTQADKDALIDAGYRSRAGTVKVRL